MIVLVSNGGIYCEFGPPLIYFPVSAQTHYFVWKCIVCWSIELIANRKKYGLLCYLMLCKRLQDCIFSPREGIVRTNKFVIEVAVASQESERSCIYMMNFNRNYSAILANLQITSYALGVEIALLFTCQLHESLIKLYFKQFSIFQLFSLIKVKVLISFAWLYFA